MIKILPFGGFELALEPPQRFALRSRMHALALHLGNEGLQSRFRINRNHNHGHSFAVYKVER